MSDDQTFRSSLATPPCKHSDSGCIPKCSVQSIVRKVPLLGRFHELPRRLSHDFTLTKEVVGSGRSGSVTKAVRSSTSDLGETFAVKTYVLTHLSAPALAALEAETKIFLSLDHPHIARLLNVYQTPESVSLVMECMHGGTLYDRVIVDKVLQEPQAAHFTQQMLLAVNYLHCNGVVHRDLKLENFVFDEKGGEVLKLIDFGFSKFRKGDAKMKTCCGTLSYIAPEILTGSYTSQCDLWSLGVIVFRLLSSYMPFSRNTISVRDKIKAGEYLMESKRWARVSADGIAFTKALLQTDPKIRLRAHEALTHSWLQRHTNQPRVEPGQNCMVASQQYSQAPRFRRCCLVAMAWLLNDKKTERVRKEFFAIDTNLHGTISLGELKAAMQNKLSVSDDDIVSIFQALHATHDDEIHYSEFLAAMLSTRIEIDDTLLYRTFRNFDKDLSGYITIENLRAAFGNAFDGQQVEALIEEVDVLKKERISFPEFAACVRGRPLGSQALQLSHPIGTSPDTLDEGNGHVVMQGWLLQRSRVSRRWRRRWCELTRSSLSCYEASSDTPSEKFTRCDCKAVVVNPLRTRMHHAFRLDVGLGRRIYFSCNDYKSKSQWLEKLRWYITSGV